MEGDCAAGRSRAVAVRFSDDEEPLIAANLRLRSSSAGLVAPWSTLEALLMRGVPKRPGMSNGLREWDAKREDLGVRSDAENFDLRKTV